VIAKFNGQFAASAQTYAGAGSQFWLGEASAGRAVKLSFVKQAEAQRPLGRMRVLSSPKVFKSAQQAMRKILDTYLEPSKTFVELRAMVNSEEADLLCDFAEGCRTEQESLSAQQF
jgi:hypothetical protein